MAKGDKPDKKDKEKNAAIADIFSEVDKLNPDATFLNDSALSFVDEFIDTGSYALNIIISGDAYKGAPRGRILGLAGPSQAGKSLFVKQILGNAQKKGYTVVIWDTENAIDGAGSEGLGLDPAKTKYYPVETVEACKNQVSTFLDRIIAANADLRAAGKPELKIAIAIDSLANLASAKELADIEKGSEAMDMGTRAKALKSMMRVLTFKAAKAKVPIIVTNHIYDNPGELRPSMVKQQSGGKGLIYLASILVQLSMTAEKSADEEGGDDDAENSPMIAIANRVNGVNLTALTTKNRFVPPYLKTRIYLNFKTGLSRYAGLFEIGTAFNVIVKTGKRWVLVKDPTTKVEDIEDKTKIDGLVSAGKVEMLGFKKEWSSDTKVWDKILPVLNEVVKKEVRFGGGALVSPEAAEAAALSESEGPDDEAGAVEG